MPLNETRHRASSTVSQKESTTLLTENSDSDDKTVSVDNSEMRGGGT